MKVIVPIVNEHHAGLAIVGEFKNANAVCIFDTDTNTTETVKVEELISSIENITVALKARGITALITNHVSFLALQLFNESQIEVYKAKGFDLETNIAHFKNGKLVLYATPASFGSCASSACSSCHTICN